MTATFYTLLIRLYSLLTRIASITNTKAKQRIRGIKKTSQLDFHSNGNENILVHCSSLGEYEQGKPIIDWVLENTNYNLVISFFSPSGYEDCDLDNSRLTKVYLPFDIPSNISAFLDKIDPKKTIILKNEWWWNLLRIINKRNIPSYLVSATIRSDHYFIKFSNRFFKEGLNSFNTIYTVDEQSKSNLSSVYNNPILAYGDTRKDRVNDSRALSQKSIHKKENCIIYGSIWKEDLKIVKHIISEFPKYTHIIYPHDLSPSNIQSIHKQIGQAEIIADTTQANTENVYINTSMGKLKYDYKHASIAYIGGGFGQGIHNILEASVYQIPVLIGPIYNKSTEAVELINKSCIFTLQTQNDFAPIKEKVTTDRSLKEIQNKLGDYFSTSNSISSKICESIFNS